MTTPSRGADVATPVKSRAASTGPSPRGKVRESGTG